MRVAKKTALLKFNENHAELQYAHFSCLLSLGPYRALTPGHAARGGASRRRESPGLGYRDQSSLRAAA